MNGVSAAVLAGGESRRMGKDKAGLELAGKTFLERIAGELDGFDEVFVSVALADEREINGLRTVADKIPGCGPIGGLHASLCECRSDWLFAVSCDIPLFSRGLAGYLLTYLSCEYDAIVAQTRDGRVHPLCAAYAKHALDTLEKQIEAGDFRMMRALEKMRVKTVQLSHSRYPDDMLQNINTPEQYAKLLRRVQGVPVVAVSGVKNSGKTTLLEGILPLLKQRGLKVAVIKHDGHDFIPDVPETDSYRIRQAGACGVAVYSEYRYLLTEERAGITVEELANQFPHADLILLEGGKHTKYPKLEVVRAAVSKTAVCDPDSVIALCTDTKLDSAVRTLNIDDCEGIAETLISFLQR